MEDDGTIIKTLIEIEVDVCQDADLLNLIYKLLLTSKQE